MPKKSDVAMFSFLGDHAGSMIPSTRITRMIAEELDVPTYWNTADVEEVQAKVLIIVNGAFAFCKVLPQLAVAIEAAKQIVWVQNDYTIIPPKSESDAESPFRRAFNNRRKAGKSHIHYWTTCRGNAKATPLSSYVNWNALTFTPLDEKDRKRLRKMASADLLYYGSFRHTPTMAKGGVDTLNSAQSRVRYFDRYFLRALMPVTISSAGLSGKPNENFVKRYPKATHVGKYQDDFLESIGSHGAGLYVEDVKSHQEFHSPANRFYEMLSAGLPIIFQPEAVGMLGRAGLSVDEWTASTPQRVMELFENREKMGRAQWDRFGGMDHRGELTRQFRAAWKTIREGAL